MNLDDIKERAFILSHIHFFTLFFPIHLYFKRGEFFFFFFQFFIMCIFLFSVSIMYMSLAESRFDLRGAKFIYIMCIH